MAINWHVTSLRALSLQLATRKRIGQLWQSRLDAAVQFFEENSADSDDSEGSDGGGAGAGEGSSGVLLLLRDCLFLPALVYDSGDVSLMPIVNSWKSFIKPHVSCPLPTVLSVSLFVCLSSIRHNLCVIVLPF